MTPIINSATSARTRLMPAPDPSPRSSVACGRRARVAAGRAANTERTNVSQPVKVCHGSEAARALQSSHASPVAAMRRPLIAIAIGTTAATIAIRRGQDGSVHASSPPIAASDTIERRPLQASAISSVVDGNSRRLPSRKTETPAVISAVSPMREARSCSGSVTALMTSVGSGIAISRNRSGAAMVRTARPPARNHNAPAAAATNETRVRKTSAAS